MPDFSILKQYGGENMCTGTGSLLFHRIPWLHYIVEPYHLEEC